MTMPYSCHAALILAFASISAFAQSESESRVAPPVYAETGQYMDSASGSSSYREDEMDSAPFHGFESDCCYDRYEQEDQPTPLPRTGPRTGPEYEYQNLGEPWDSHARLRRAQNETKDAQAEVDRTSDAHNKSSRELEIAEMTYNGYESQDEWFNPTEQEENEYEHTGYEERQAWRRYDSAHAEEAEAQGAADAADADYGRWLEQQPVHDYSRPYVTELPDTDDSDVLSKDDLFRMLENVSRDDYYKALRNHADGKGTIEEVEAAYAQLVEWRR